MSEKVEAVMGWERSKSVFEIRSFLGLDVYYRRFENGLKLSISGQDRRTSPTGHGLHGWDGPDHRERDR